MTHAFRVVFRLAAEGVLQSKQEFLEFKSGTDGKALKLSAGTKGVPIEDCDRFSVSGGEFDSPEEADRVADSVRHSLLLFAARTRSGMDLGQNSLRSFRMSAYGKQLVAKELGANAVLEDHLGITVYQTEPKPTFVRMNMSGRVSRPAEALTSDLAASVGKLRFTSRKAETAAGLYALSHFAARAEARFLLLFIALEALFKPVKRSGKVQAHIDFLLDRTTETDLSAEEKQALASALSFQRTESIAATGRRLAVSALGNQLYGSLSPDAFFAKIYKVRNDLVHRGKMDPEELHVLVGDVDHFVADIVSRQVK